MHSKDSLTAGKRVSPSLALCFYLAPHLLNRIQKTSTPQVGVQNEAKPQAVAKEANMGTVAKKVSNEKKVDFDGKV
jgi:uncharacterized phage infection (PIP) family protein YhgE